MWDSIKHFNTVIRFAIFTTAIAGMAAFTPENAIAELKHRWSFNDNGDVSDSIGIAHLTIGDSLGAGEVSGGVLRLGDGPTLSNDVQALTTNGALGNIATTINSANAITMEFWFKQTTATLGSRLILAGTGHTPEYLDVTPHRDGGFTGSGPSASIRDSISGFEDSVTAPLLVDGDDYYAAIVWDDNGDRIQFFTAKLGIDGISSNVQAMTQELSNVDISKFALGSAISGISANDFKGEIDEFRIWNNAFDINDVTQSLLDGPNGIETPSTTIPEPATFFIWACLGLGLLAYGWRVRGKRT